MVSPHALELLVCGLPFVDVADWKAHTDPASGKTYYYSKAENQTTWTRPQPPSLIPVDRPSNSSQARASAHSQANPLLTVIRPLIAGGADRQRFRQR